MAKILMINLPLSGHTNPTLPLARELSKRGHTVHYINGPEWKEKIEATGAKFIPYINYPRRLSQSEAQKLSFIAAYNTAIKLKGSYDVLIYETLFFMGKALSDRLGIPSIRQFSTIAINEASLNHIRENTPLGKVNYKVLNRPPVSKEACEKMNIIHKGYIESVISERPHLDIVYTNSKFQPLREKFDKGYIFVGPSLDDARKSDITIPYEKMKRHIVYISLGSILSSKSFCKRCIRAFKDKNVSVILTTGKVDPKSLGPLPENIYAYSFVPQLEVLKHADVFITHAGMNSVNEAMYYGVPMLVMPIIGDQSLNAEQVIKLGLGKKLKILLASGRAMYNTTIEILCSKKIKENALKMKESIKNDLGVNGAAEKVELLLKEFKTN